nr:PREDICTED: cilia- and flagella-associated protein 221 [Latimeria chalumnae]|eukprot:XP_014341077.1 PREDICTED: cilia- and flagella-associated protein 221 [Latimeria chalumnae]
MAAIESEEVALSIDLRVNLPDFLLVSREDEERKGTSSQQLLDPRQRSRKKRQLKHSQRIVIERPKKKEHRSTKFPVALSSAYKVDADFIQEPGKLKAKDLREAVMSQATEQVKSRQMREAIFEQKFRQDVLEEEANQLQWQVHLGKDPLSTKMKRQILAEKKAALEEYKMKRVDYNTRKEFESNQTLVSSIRVLRSVGQFPSYRPQFDLYSDNPWFLRRSAISRFQQAARKVQIQYRTNQRLILLRELVKNVKMLNATGIPLTEDNLPQTPTVVVGEEDDLFPLKLSLENMSPFVFPSYVSPNWKDDLAPDALGVVPVPLTEVEVRHAVPFFNLKVPQHYKLMEYRPVSTLDISSYYYPLTLSRHLRTGAEDELFPTTVSATVRPESRTCLIDLEEQPDQSFQKDSTAYRDAPGVLNLLPPKALLKPSDHHPIQIFNPAPGLLAFKQPVKYMETDLEYHLCPIPRYTISKDCAGGTFIPSTQKKFLHRKEVIRGIMTWKKFPSAAFSALASTPTITSAWMPRRSDPFSVDMLPVLVSPTLINLPEKDGENVQESGEGDVAVSLTPEMLKSEFTFLESSTPDEELKEKTKENSDTSLQSKTASSNTVKIPVTVSRDLREEQLETFLQSQNNKQGAKVQARLDHMRSMASDKSLVLD